MSRHTKEEAEKTRASIMRAAEACFYARGVVSTSLNEVAQEAGVTRGAVYWHFKDKADLLRAIADDVFLPQEELLENLASKDLAEPLEDLKEACLDSLKKIMHDARRRRVFTILTQRCEYIEEMADMVTRNQSCRTRVLLKVADIFEQARKKKKLAACWTPHAAALLLQSAFLGFIMSEMEHHHPSPTRDRTYKSAINAFFRALGNS